MNQVLDTIAARHSVRDYLSTPVEQEKLQAIIEAYRLAPNSINGQQTTLMVIQDPERKAKMMQWAWGQPYIGQAPVFFVMCLDYHRIAVAGEAQGINVQPDNLDALVTGTFDGGLALQNMMIAAQSLGLSTVTIGAIRGNIDEIREELHLPKHVLPLVGLVVGYANPETTTTPKPRLPESATVFYERYDETQLVADVQAFDAEILGYNATREGKKSAAGWVEKTAGFYSKNVNPKFVGQLKQAGFDLKE
ncbi:MAG: nitroreductase family protein [Culicoidibacterales bacterium]